MYAGQPVSILSTTVLSDEHSKLTSNDTKYFGQHVSSITSSSVVLCKQKKPIIMMMLNLSTVYKCAPRYTHNAEVSQCDYRLQRMRGEEY